jgi:hypothetical protein
MIIRLRDIEQAIRPTELLVGQDEAHFQGMPQVRSCILIMANMVFMSPGPETAEIHY